MIIPINNKKMSSAAVGAKTARACDYCITKRARWYCAADDAFLCQACDSSVHSANSLARRHERVRLKASSSSLKLPKLSIHPPNNPSVPSWHRGLTRKARTPRHGKQAAVYRRQTTASETKSDDITQQYPLHPLVPELGGDHDSYSLDGNEEEQLLYRVPVYDPFVVEFHASTPISNEDTPPTDDAELTVKPKASELVSLRIDPRDDINYSFLPSDMDLAEFAADVETLLGKGLDQETYTIEELGLLDDDVREENSAAVFEDYQYSICTARLPSGSVVKAEGNSREAVTMGACHAETEPFALSFDYDEYPPTTREEKDAKAVIAGGQAESLAKDLEANRSLHRDEDRDEEEEKKKKTTKKKKGKKISLSLDYEAIRAVWGGQGSPWMNGERPEIDPDDGWPHGTGSCGTDVHQQPYGMRIFGGGGEQGSTAGGGREARVLRYREKRRTRLFSKKIRYEVRKLNAEKRPRMKGRFVKRSSFVAPAGIPIMGK